MRGRRLGDSLGTESAGRRAGVGLVVAPGRGRKDAMTFRSDTQTPGTADTPRTSWLQLGVISAAAFVVWVGFGAMLPYLPLFLSEQAHASMTLWAVIASMFYVGTLLFSSPLGWLSDTDRTQAGDDRRRDLCTRSRCCSSRRRPTPTGSSSSGFSKASGRRPSGRPPRRSSPTSPTSRTAARPMGS